MDSILTIKVPVPIPEIKTFSRWKVFLALFDRKAHFTTCDTLRHQLYRETEIATLQMVKRQITDRKLPDDNLSVHKVWGGV